MRSGILFLVLGYVLSQFYRAFLAVLAPMLREDVGATAADLALASGLWFIAFAGMQIPVGWALDRIGPRRTAAWMLGIAAGGGAIVMAAAQDMWAVHLAMILLGIGCAPVLVSSYYIFARIFPAAIFATLAGLTIGFGSLGNLASAWPLAVTAELIGWRAAVLVLAVLTLAIALAVLRFVQDPPPLNGDEAGGSLLDLLRMPALWLLFPLLLVNYSAAAGIRGLWVGPFYEEVFNASATSIGIVTLVMGLAMVLGNFLYGPLDRILGTRKWVVLGGNAMGVVCLLTLALLPLSYWGTALLLAGVGLFGASYPVLMAHGRSFFPAGLTGRGVTLLNLFSIGGVGAMQLVSAQVHAVASTSAATPMAAYQTLFLFFGLALAAGGIIYAFSQDRTD